MTNQKLAIGIPTLNEATVIRNLILQLRERFPNSLMIIVDDNSSDGTQDIIRELAATDALLMLIARPRKLGIGSAHQEIIAKAYEQKCNKLLTLDADGTHSVADVAELLSSIGESDIIVGSRYLSNKSLAGWSLYRKTLTYVGHFLTSFFLKIPYDSTGSLRLYDLTAIPQELFRLVRSKGYAFFFESMFLLTVNGFRIKEVSVALPARTYGTSKMELRQAFISLMFLVRLYIEARIARDYFITKRLPEKIQIKAKSYSEWNDYWVSDVSYNSLYSAIYPIPSSLYRYYIIRPSLERVVRKYLVKNSKLLHVGSGSGQVDISLRYDYKITALDSSFEAANYYYNLNADYCSVLCEDLLTIDIKEEYDAAYSLGLFEHFTEQQIYTAINKLKDSIRPGGYLITFWPPEFGLSVRFFKVLGYLVAGDSSNRSDQFHPPEINRLKSKEQAVQIFKDSGMEIVDVIFNFKDLYTQIQIIAQKPLNL
ncbi:MAG: glycosyltransferase [Proteobacteria bacterium]|nr:glycosyltransferase [Pseudomonadota bacterium]